MQKRKIVLGDREAKTVMRRIVTHAPLRAVAAPNEWAIIGANRLGKPAWPSTRKFCRKYRASRIWPEIWRNPAVSTKLGIRTSPKSLTLPPLLGAGSRPAAYAARFRQRVVTDCFDAPLADLAEGDDDREYRYTA